MAFRYKNVHFGEKLRTGIRSFCRYGGMVEVAEVDSAVCVSGFHKALCPKAKGAIAVGVDT